MRHPNRYSEEEFVAVVPLNRLFNSFRCQELHVQLLNDKGSISSLTLQCRSTLWEQIEIGRQTAKRDVARKMWEVFEGFSSELDFYLNF